MDKPKRASSPPTTRPPPLPPPATPPRPKSGYSPNSSPSPIRRPSPSRNLNPNYASRLPPSPLHSPSSSLNFPPSPFRNASVNDSIDSTSSALSYSSHHSQHSTTSQNSHNSGGNDRFIPSRVTSNISQGSMINSDRNQNVLQSSVLSDDNASHNSNGHSGHRPKTPNQPNNPGSEATDPRMHNGALLLSALLRTELLGNAPPSPNPIPTDDNSNSSYSSYSSASGAIAGQWMPGGEAISDFNSTRMNMNMNMNNHHQHQHQQQHHGQGQGESQNERNVFSFRSPHSTTHPVYVPPGPTPPPNNGKENRTFSSIATLSGGSASVTSQLSKSKSSLVAGFNLPPSRKIPKVPFKVLDAPALQDDFYLNLVDWSASNVLAVGLGSCVYLWSACTSKVTKLCGE